MRSFRLSRTLIVSLLCLTFRPANAQDAAAGSHVFKTQCGICHTVVKDRNLVGPSLFGIIGRKAGTEPHFRYSAANRDSGIVWNDETLEKYLPEPRKMIPGTSMTYPGLKNPQQLKDLIAYLNTLK